MYICKPERNVRQAMILLFVSVFVTLAFFLCSTLVSEFSGLLRMCGFVSLMFGILFNVRYSLTEFEYSVDGSGFAVTKITGNRRQVVCCIALETAVDLMEKNEYDHLPSNEKAIIKYSLNQNMKAKSFVFLCEFNGKRTMIEFEPNKEFVSILKQEIARAKSSKEEE